jgi:electron transport complex protein RnfC
LYIGKKNFIVKIGRMKVYTFPRGGLSFDDPAVPPKDFSVVAFLPVLTVVPIGSGTGGRVYPLVNVGERVKEGMLIGRASGPGEANVHATVPGRVARKIPWKDNEGNSCNALLIRMEGSFDRLGRREEVFSWSGMNCYDLQRIIAEYGVVEMEGSGIPAAEIISAFRRAGEAGSLVVRCVFDDPWLAADYVLCRERLAAVVEGSAITVRAAGKLERIVFAVSHQERDLGEAMLAEAARWDIPAFLALVGSRYPQRNRRELELVLRNYEKKEGPALGSLLILGPATMAAVYDAVKFKRPPLDRYVAVGGPAVKTPQVMKARIGKQLGELFAECGGFVAPPKHIAKGTPLLGRAVLNLNEPLTKTCFAVFAMLKARSADHPERNCIGCGECRNVCPVGLDPEELYKAINAFNSAPPEGAAECHGCGCCEAVCPSQLPLSGVIRGNPQGERYA